MKERDSRLSGGRVYRPLSLGESWSKNRPSEESQVPLEEAVLLTLSGYHWLGAAVGGVALAPKLRSDFRAQSRKPFGQLDSLKLEVSHFLF